MIDQILLPCGTLEKLARVAGLSGFRNFLTKIEIAALELRKDRD
jgi:hypothetical protein